MMGPDNGIVNRESRYSVDETLHRLEERLHEKSVKVFAVVDHSGEAAKAGIVMPATKLAIFGNPKAGTPLMLAAPSVAIDLPLKMLIREDADGKVWVSYNSPAYLAARHGLPEGLQQNIAIVKQLADAISE